MSINHRAEAERAISVAPHADGSTAIATIAIAHALLAIHDLLAKRLPSALDGFAATEDPAATEAARCGCGRAVPCRHCEEPDTTGTDTEDADAWVPLTAEQVEALDQGTVVRVEHGGIATEGPFLRVHTLGGVVLMQTAEDEWWAGGRSGLPVIVHVSPPDAARLADDGAGRVRWCNCADAPWDDARCREGECRESWRDAEEAGR